jgi:hypothetical protein
MTVQIENVVESVSENNSEIGFEKFTTKAVCKRLGCKGSSLKDAMKYINLKIDKDEFGNRWFSEEDIKRIREGIRSRKTNLLLKILSKELEKENNCETSGEQHQYTIKNQTQTCVGQLVEQFKLEMHNALEVQTASISEEIKSLNIQNETERSREQEKFKIDIQNTLTFQTENLKDELNTINSNNEEQSKLEIQNVLTKQTETVRNELNIVHKLNDELRRLIEEQFKQEMQYNLNKQTEVIRNDINSIHTQEEEFIAKIKEEMQSILTLQTEAVRNEIIILYKHNDELKKRVEELTRMIQTTQEGHFKAVDERLHQLIESSKRRGLFRSK